MSEFWHKLNRVFYEHGMGEMANREWVDKLNDAIMEIHDQQLTRQEAVVSAAGGALAYLEEFFGIHSGIDSVMGQRAQYQITQLKEALEEADE